MGYDTQELAEYLAKIRGQNVGSITDQVPSFTNISSVADAGAFDVRSPQQRLEDDVAQDQAVLEQSKQNEKQAKEKNSIRSTQLNEIYNTDTLRQMKSKEEHELRVKIRADHKAIDDAEGIPVHDMRLDTYMRMGGDFQSDLNYINAYNQRDAAIIRANKKKKDLLSSYEDSQLYLDQIDDRITTVEPIEKANRTIEADKVKLATLTAAEKGVTPKELANIAIMHGVTVEEVKANPTYITDMSDKTVEVLDAYTKNPTQFNAKDIALQYPDFIDGFLRLEEKRLDRTKSEVEKQSAVKGWSEDGLKAMEKITRVDAQKETEGFSRLPKEEQKIRLDTLKAREYAKTINAETAKFKKQNTKVEDLSLDDDPEASEVDKRSADFIMGYMKDTLKGRNIYDVGYWEVFVFTQTIITASGYKDDIHHGTKLNDIARRMFRRLITKFNAENTESMGISLTTDDFAMWGVQP